MHLNYHFATQQNLQNSLENSTFFDSENKSLFTDHGNNNEYDDCNILNTSSAKT